MNKIIRIFKCRYTRKTFFSRKNLYLVVVVHNSDIDLKIAVAVCHSQDFDLKTAFAAPSLDFDL